MTTANLSYVATISLCAIVGTTAWMMRPFPDVVDRRAFSTSMLTPFQKVNLQQAAQKLNGRIIESGNRFSFNKAVGPRSEERGYLPSKSYVNGATVDTTGGGICVVSSYLYQLALDTGMKIDERKPHMRTVRSVSPGLDATVWYGQADLAFVNTTKSPVKILAHTDANNFTIEFLGNKNQIPLWAVATKVVRRNGDRAVVCVTRTQNGVAQTVSTDVYQLN